jgi:hypothetical protein
MTPVQDSVLHLLSAMVIAVVGAGVCLWALLTRPRIRWDRFWIGLALMLLVAPIAFIVTAVRMASSLEARNRLDGDPDRATVRMDTTFVVDTISAMGVDSLSAVRVENRVDTVNAIVVDAAGDSAIESN